MTHKLSRRNGAVTQGVPDDTGSETYRKGFQNFERNPGGHSGIVPKQYVLN